MNGWELFSRLLKEGCGNPDGRFGRARVEIEIDGKRYELRETGTEGGYSTCPVVVLYAEAK